MATKHVDKVEAQLSESLKYSRERIERWDRDRFHYLQVMDKLDGTEGVSFEFYSNLSINAAGDGSLLTLIVRILRTSGWETGAKAPAKNDPEWYAGFHKPEAKDRTIHLYFTSKVCRKVQVGSRLEEVPVYEIQCGDISMDGEVKSA